MVGGTPLNACVKPVPSRAVSEAEIQRCQSRDNLQPLNIDTLGGRFRNKNGSGIGTARRDCRAAGCISLHIVGDGSDEQLESDLCGQRSIGLRQFWGWQTTAGVKDLLRQLDISADV